MNSDGQLIISDLLLYLVLLTFVFILIIYLYGVIDDDSTDVVGDSYYNNKLNSVMSMLVLTGGSPGNWEYLSDDKVESIGLCKSGNGSYVISYDKLMRLRGDDYLLGKFLSDVDYVCLYPRDNPDNIINIHGKYTSGTDKNILTKSVVVIMDYGFDILPIRNDTMDYNCPLNHFNDSHSWSCKSFMIDSSKLSNGKYYLVTNKSCRYVLSNTYGESYSYQSSGYVDITDKIKTLCNNAHNETITIHINNSNSINYLAYDDEDRYNHIASVIYPEVYILQIGLSM